MAQITFQEWYAQLTDYDLLIIDNCCETQDEYERCVAGMYATYLDLDLGEIS